MPDDDMSARSMARDFLLFIVLPCALLTAIAYVYMAYFAPKPYAGVKLQDGVVYVSARRFETHGLEALTASGDAVEATAWTAPAVARGTPSTATVLIHGYNAQDGKVATYFAALATSLRNNADRSGPLIVFDWPATAVPFDELPTSDRIRRDMYSYTKNTWSQPAYEFNMYRIDQRKAESIGATAIVALLVSLTERPDTTVHVVAHSMGCYLLARAMQQQPAAFSPVGSMIWLAPDVDATVVDEPWFRQAIGQLRTGLFVHYSRNDTTLTLLSRAANGVPRLGAVGRNAGGSPVPKLEFIDMTVGLGTDDVHAGYLRSSSPSLPLIAEQLAERR
jgi:esterase/lipase superfamily enzyme